MTWGRKRAGFINQLFYTAGSNAIPRQAREQSMNQHLGSDLNELVGVGFAQLHTAVIPIGRPAADDMS